MDKKIYICAAVILLFALLAFLAYKYLEIYEDKTYSPPSREVRANTFLAMEKWLAETGHPVRIEKQCTPEKIAAIPEKAAIVFAEAAEWEDAQKFLCPWIEQGNSLVICLNKNIHEIDENLLEFLSGFGIEVEITSEISRGEDIPDFDFGILFYTDDNSEICTISDNKGNVRLAEVYPGKGTLTVTGYPIFMQNGYLKSEKNALLSWELTGKRSNEDNKGVLFVREKEKLKANPFFGKIFEKGNLVPLSVSAFLVVILGFWMVIPVFGLVFEEREKSSRPIRERFAAEINFLKKYKSLNYYLEIYERELQYGNNAEKDKKYSYKEIMNKLRGVYDGTDKLKRKIGSY